jgi:hypothetical protein
MNPPGKDPITKLYEAVRVSERMNGIEVLFGKRAAPNESSAARIVMVPTGGPISQPDHQGNRSDAGVSVECECWGADFSQLWEVIRCLLCAVYDYGFVGDNPADATADGVSDCVRPDPVSIEFEEEPDTNRQGWFAIVSINVVASLEFTPLVANASRGTVDTVTVQPA